jgi:hypothetical protein
MFPGSKEPVSSQGEKKWRRTLMITRNTRGNKAG